MPRRRLRKLFGTLLLSWSVGSLAALYGQEQDSWPEFRGPTGQGHTAATGLPLSWSERENVVWKTPVAGRGWSSPVILDGQVWMTTALDEGRSLRAVCLDAATGRMIHDVEVFRPQEPCPINAKNSHASPTPVLEPGRVYVHFGTMGTACLDTKTGKVLWRNNTLVLDHKEGPGSSPILFGDLLIVNCDGMDVRYVVALDRRTGETVWKTDRITPWHDRPDFNKAYSVPLLVDNGEHLQLISPGAQGVCAYDPRTGEDLWHVRYDGFSTAPRPVFGHGMVYLSTGYMKPELLAVRIGGRGDVTQTHVAWRYRGQAPLKPSPLLVGDELFMVSDAGIAVCLDALTGQELWKERLGGNFSASPLYAEGRVYFFGEDGKTSVVAAAGEFRPLATSQLDGSFMASAAVAGRALFLRTDRAVYRIEDPAAKAAPAP